MSISIPPDAPYSVQKALRELDEKIDYLVYTMAKGVSPSDLSQAYNTLLAKIDETYRKPTTLDFNDVFRGGGAHALGYVPDPGLGPPDGEHVLTSTGAWGPVLEGLVRAVPAGLGGSSRAQRVVNVLASLAVLNALSAETVRARNAQIRTLTVDDLSYTDSYFDDLRFQAGGFNPAGSTAPATVNTTTGLLDFSGTADNIMGGVAQMPHCWKQGTALSPHLHLIFPTSASANTRWKLEHSVANISEDFGGLGDTVITYTPLTVITVANPQNVMRHVVAEFGDIDMTGKTMSCCVLWKLTRLAASDAADNHTSAVSLIEFDLHYEIDRPGSREEYVK